MNKYLKLRLQGYLQEYETKGFRKTVDRKLKTSQIGTRIIYLRNKNTKEKAEILYNNTLNQTSDLGIKK